MTNKHIGSTFSSFLDEEGLSDEPTECVVDLTNVHDDEHALLLTLKARIDAHLRGETKTVSMADGERQVSARLRAFRRARAKR